MIALRWEILRLVEPWAAPQSSLLGFPLLSGTIARDDGADDARLFAASDPIVVPAAIEGERHFLVSLEAFGGRAWTVTLGTSANPPQPCDGQLHANDPVASVYVPSGGMTGSARSREVRAVRPGVLFIAQPSRT